MIVTGQFIVGELAGMTRLELAASALTGQRSNQLSYTPTLRSTRRTRYSLPQRNHSCQGYVRGFSFDKRIGVQIQWREAGEIMIDTFLRPKMAVIAGLLCCGLLAQPMVWAAPEAASGASSASAEQTDTGFPVIPGLTGQYGDYRGKFQTLTDPKVVPMDELTGIDDDDEVLGLTLGGESRAYPARFISWHHIVNDMLGGKPVCITYCIVCNSGIAYDPLINGSRHLFDVFGIYRGVMAMVDPTTNTVWAHLTGMGLAGPDTGKTLRPIPIVNTTWGEWKRLHPHSTTPAWDEQFRKYYGRKVVSGLGRVPKDFLSTLQGVVNTEMFARVYANDVVLAVRVNDKPRAYPFKTLAEAPGVVQEALGDTPVAVFYDAATKTGAAFDRRLDGEVLEFHRLPGSASLFEDSGTCSQWTIEGTAVAGQLAGRSLERLTYLQAEWYGWTAYFPETTIYPDAP
jgi:hypothetical protein